MSFESSTDIALVGEWRLLTRRVHTKYLLCSVFSGILLRAGSDLCHTTLLHLEGILGTSLSEFTSDRHIHLRHTGGRDEIQCYRARWLCFTTGGQRLFVPI